MLCLVATEMFRRDEQNDESFYFYDSPPIYHSLANNQPLYFASTPPCELPRFNYLQSSSAGALSNSEASNSQVLQFASSARSDSPGLDRLQATPSPVESSSSSENGAKKSWTREDTLALIEHYRNRRDGFRDPKIKNKQVWEQIAEAMKIDGVSCFGAKECETKFTACIDHNKISGNDPKKCSFFEELQELFSNDDAIEPVAVCSNRMGYRKKREASNLEDVAAGGAGSSTEEECKERKLKKKKQTPKQREASELVTLFKEYSQAREESEEKRLQEMKDMHDEKMNAMSKFLEIFAKSVQKD